jgi:hypothetical protein
MSLSCRSRRVNARSTARSPDRCRAKSRRVVIAILAASGGRSKGGRPTLTARSSACTSISIVREHRKSSSGVTVPGVDAATSRPGGSLARRDLSRSRSSWNFPATAAGSRRATYSPSCRTPEWGSSSRDRLSTIRMSRYRSWASPTSGSSGIARIEATFENTGAEIGVSGYTSDTELGQCARIVPPLGDPPRRDHLAGQSRCRRETIAPDCHGHALFRTFGAPNNSLQIGSKTVQRTRFPSCL